MVSDYGYGSVSDQLIEQIKKLHIIHSCPLLIDSKNLYRFRNVGATVVTPNYQEARLLVEHGQIAESSVSRIGIDLSEVERVARRLLSIIDAEHAAITLAGERLLGKTIVFTNGVFDILHAGHVQFLRQAKELGDILIVGINSDSSTRRLKGERRPINSERDRMALVAALDPVDYVVLFEEDTPIQLIRAFRPDIHVKGGDYTDEFLPEAESVREVGGRVVILPLAGSLSTTNMIRRIISLATEESIEVKQ